MWGGCLFFTDLFLCHLSGTMIGYGLFTIVWAVLEKRKKKAMGVIRRRWWSVLLYQLPLLCICLLIAVPCLVYRQQELGHVTWEYPNLFGTKPQMETVCQLSDNPLQGMVYADVPKNSLPDGLAAEVKEDRVKISREYQGIANNYAYKEFPMISEKAAFEHFCESDMVDCRENYMCLYENCVLQKDFATKSLTARNVQFYAEKGELNCTSSLDLRLKRLGNC